MLPSLAAQAGNWQFSAIGGDVAVTNGEAVVSWSGFGGSTLAPLHGSGNSWGSPAATNGAVRFSAGATPLALPESATSLVSRVFVVATATNLAERSTLLFASTSVWLAPTPSGGFTLAPALGGRVSSVTVNGLPEAPVLQGERFLAEIVLADPIAAAGVFLGAHAATPLWQRGWQGDVHEVVMLGPEAPAQNVQAVRAFLSHFWRTPDAPPAPQNAQALLRGLGLSSHGFYTTLLVTH